MARETQTRGTPSRGTASRGTTSRSADSRGTVSRRTASSSTASRGTASRGTADRSSRNTSGRGTASRSQSTSRMSAGRNMAGQPVRRQPQKSSRQPTKQSKETPLSPAMKTLFAWLEALIEAAAIVFVLFFLIWPLKVNGVSMSPTLVQDNRILVSRAAALFGSFDRGDIVICWLEDEKGDRVQAVRRVIGVPGDTINISAGQVFINGAAIREDYLAPGTITQPDGFIALDSKEYYVMGDSRGVSGDSRIFGAIEKRDISSKVVFKLNPFGGFDKPDLDNAGEDISAETTPETTSETTTQ